MMEFWSASLFHIDQTRNKNLDQVLGCVVVNFCKYLHDMGTMIKEGYNHFSLCPIYGEVCS